MDVCINQLVNAGVFHVSRFTLTYTGLSNIDQLRSLAVRQADRSDSKSATVRCRIQSFEGYRLRYSSRNVHRRKGVENHRHSLDCWVQAQRSCLCKGSSLEKPLITLIFYLSPAGLLCHR